MIVIHFLWLYSVCSYDVVVEENLKAKAWKSTVRGNHSYAMPHTLGPIVAPREQREPFSKGEKFISLQNILPPTIRDFFSVLLTTSSLDVMHHKNSPIHFHCIQDTKLLSRWKPSTLPPS